MRNPFCRPHTEDIERRRIEILAEMEDFQTKLLREMFGVDRHTLQKLRDIMEDYYNIKNNLSAMLDSFVVERTKHLAEYEIALSKMNDDFIESLKTKVQELVLRDYVNQAVNEAVSITVESAISEFEIASESIKQNILNEILNELPTAEGERF